MNNKKIYNNQIRTMYWSISDQLILVQSILCWWSRELEIDTMSINKFYIVIVSINIKSISLLLPISQTLMFYWLISIHVVSIGILLSNIAPKVIYQYILDKYSINQYPDRYCTNPYHHCCVINWTLIGCWNYFDE